MGSSDFPVSLGLMELHISKKPGMVKASPESFKNCFLFMEFILIPPNQRE
jgi:hypothetical protein